MRIVEKDFIMEPCGFGLFDLTFLKKDNSGEIKKCKPAYGCTLASCVKRIIKHRVGTMYESESPYLLDVLNKILKVEEDIMNFCREPIEDFDTGE